MQDRRGERLLLDWLGNLHFMRGDYRAAAETQQQALALAQETRDQADAWEAIGRSRLAAGDHAAALAAYRAAFEVARGGPEPHLWLQVQALRGEGLVHLQARDYAAAVRAFERALALSKEAGMRGLAGPLLSSLGVAQGRAGRFKDAELALRRALEVPEAFGSELARADREIDRVPLPAALQSMLGDLRPMLRDWMPHTTALTVDGYACGLLADLLVAQQRAAEALEIAERCRGRVLVQRLALRALPEEAQPPTIGLIRAIAREQNATLVEYTLVYEPAPVPDWIADRETALLVFVVAPDGAVHARRVALDADAIAGMESVAELVDVSRQALGVRGRGAAGARARLALADARLRQLHRLLIEPIADLLPRDADARVIFVPQESLFLVPFAALLDGAGRALVEKHTLSVAPSIHTLAFTRRVRRAQAAPAAPHGERALIVGNPAMPSYAPAPGLAPQPLPDLPDSEAEAKAIAQLLQADALIGKRATKAAFKARLPQAQIVHLATHGLLDDVQESRPKMPFARHAALTGLLQPGTTQFRAPGSLALAPDAQDAGLLTADEIAQLATGAHLVVMSACDTGRGAIVGDGVIGLARSWIAAGVPSVVASLWAVPDEATRELMLAFHRHLRQRPNIAWALRQAMLHTRQRHPDPMSWAAFVLIGEAQ
jgi:CHAT domain-containing protein